LNYLNGKNVPKDCEKALAWFLHAGKNNHNKSYLEAVEIFRNGSEDKLIKKDLKNAMKIYLKI
jgi:TPR repeat protein